MCTHRSAGPCRVVERWPGECSAKHRVLGVFKVLGEEPAVSFLKLYIPFILFLSQSQQGTSSSAGNAPLLSRQSSSFLCFCLSHHYIASFHTIHILTCLLPLRCHSKVNLVHIHKKLCCVAGASTMWVSFINT